MAYSVATGYTLEATFKGLLFQQTIMNIRHYRITAIGAVTDGATILDSVNAVIQQGGGLDEKLSAAMSAQVSERKIRLQWIDPLRYRAKEYDCTADSGTGPVDCESAVLAASIELAAEEADRHGVGRMQLTGVANSWCNNGLVTGPYFALLGSLATALTGNLITADGVTLAPVILDRNDIANSYIVRQAGPKETLRSQRTRIVGRGM